MKEKTVRTKFTGFVAGTLTPAEIVEAMYWARKFACLSFTEIAKNFSITVETTEVPAKEPE